MHIGDALAYHIHYTQIITVEFCVISAAINQNSPTSPDHAIRIKLERTIFTVSHLQVVPVG